MKNSNKQNYNWDFSLLLKSDNLKDLEGEKKEIKKEVDSFVQKWRGKDFLKDAKTLKKALDDYESLRATYGTSGKQGYYYFLKSSLDQSNPKLKAKVKKIEEFSKKQEDKIRFFNLKISKAPKEKQKIFLESEILSEYRNYLKTSFREGRYLLTEKEERILSLKNGPAYDNWVEMTEDFLSRESGELINKKGKKEEKSFSEIVSLLRSKDKKVRDKAAEIFNHILDKNVDVAEIEFNSVLENKKINDHLRGFDRPDQARFISDDVEVETVDILVKTVTDNFDIAREYYKLKATLFNVKKLKYHERSVPYQTIDKEYSFEDACQIVKETLSDLDPEFEDIFHKFVEEGHLDAFPKKGKRGGAFCIHNLIDQPVYILLNYNRKFEDLVTFIHESGHGINNEIMRKKQNSLNFGISTFTAEVASTFFEDFVSQKLMAGEDKDMKLALIMQKLDRDIATIYRQIAAVNFEREVHNKYREKGYLSKDDIGNLFRKHMKAYMGDYVEQSPGSENWWVYWSHLRRFFYNYSYAGGLLISKALQRKVKRNPEFIEEIKKFLEAGTSKSPKEIFKEMNIDIQNKEFWLKGIKETKDLLKTAKKLSDN